ncbi:SgcJ/EcaC family oxidoreductase [Lentzea sp. BCCO 10_0856]|uniref:SgcJ/EcaC family oxidoreductase n=1 Tax=Lentzea miocenica TaxID=3095431 RepID=A0ABU4TFL8_9PSEU|nr:SgcJ/EcaC family oxidoreductase [Lentzea sp. BCCO 10_0856]MDX8036989.1 SgcJ/EcaC family oxidoreductase [Lentzea sp. BCCO 10_0856]
MTLAQDTTAQDTADIEALVATVQHAQQNELPEEFIGLFRQDAIWTTAHGKRLTGRDEIASFTRQVLPGAGKEALAAYEVSHVLFIRPDVAAVKIRQRRVTPDGEYLELAEGSPLYVVSKEDDGWRIVAGQNTIVL